MVLLQPNEDLRAVSALTGLTSLALAYIGIQNPALDAIRQVAAFLCLACPVRKIALIPCILKWREDMPAACTAFVFSLKHQPPFKLHHT